VLYTFFFFIQETKFEANFIFVPDYKLLQQQTNDSIGITLEYIKTQRNKRMFYRNHTMYIYTWISYLWTSLNNSLTFETNMNFYDFFCLLIFESTFNKNKKSRMTSFSIPGVLIQQWNLCKIHSAVEFIQLLSVMRCFRSLWSFSSWWKCFWNFQQTCNWGYQVSMKIEECSLLEHESDYKV